MKVENKNAHRAANKHYYFATHVRDGDGSGKGDVVLMLLTEKELLRAEERAKKNPEDLPKNYAIIQGGLLATKDQLGKTNCCKNSPTILDDSDVAQPKRSGGFFSWLMGDA